MGTCDDLIECQTAREISANQCIDQTSPDSHALFESIIECNMENNCADVACALENCRGEYNACWIDRRMFGNATCGDTWDCVLECDVEDLACLDACYEAATQDAYLAYVDVLLCADANACEREGCDECALETLSCRGE
jgi:hypothetical protein